VRIDVADRESSALDHLASLCFPMGPLKTPTASAARRRVDRLARAYGAELLPEWGQAYNTGSEVPGLILGIKFMASRRRATVRSVLGSDWSTLFGLLCCLSLRIKARRHRSPKRLLKPRRH